MGTYRVTHEAHDASFVVAIHQIIKKRTIKSCTSCINRNILSVMALETSDSRIIYFHRHLAHLD